MITSAILYIVYSFIWLATAVLPVAVLPASIENAVNNASSALGVIDPILAIATLVLVIGAFLVFESGVLLYKLIMWVIRRIPGQG